MRPDFIPARRGAPPVPPAVEAWPPREGCPQRWTVTAFGQSHIVTREGAQWTCSCGKRHSAARSRPGDACEHMQLIARAEKLTARRSRRTLVDR